MKNRMTGKFVNRLLISVFFVTMSAVVSFSGPLPHGLEPADDMTYLPELGGLRNLALKNQFGQPRALSEAVVLRKSSIKEGVATVPAGGLFYLSETSKDAAPFRRDPFLLLGEHCYLVDLKTKKSVYENVSLKKGDKKLIGDSGYRLWFDYSTDHFEKPYAELALIAPSGAWPIEFPVSTSFPGRDDVKNLKTGSGFVPQLDDFYLDRKYTYGATTFEAEKIDFHDASFKTVEYPEVVEAVFSMHRPVCLDVRQEDYRFYFNKRVYAFRRPEGFLVRVTDFSGETVLAEKLVKPVTAQGYKDRQGVSDDYHLTIPELDMRIELTIQPGLLKHSDFVPWSNDAPYGWEEGTLNFVIYDNLMTLKNGDVWPLDSRYRVGLEANLLTGKLKRVVLENRESFTLSHDHPSYKGPVKYSEIWNRPAFTVVADHFDDETVHTLYLRDSFYQRTDNMVFWEKEGRENIDFFVGKTPALMPILEDTFLTRLADTSFGTVVEPSAFTSYPKVFSDASFIEPDPSAPFVRRLKGLKRKISKNRKKERLLSAEGIVIRGSYVDYKKGKIVIPPAGLYYTSRNARNIRTLAGESFLLMGQKAYLTSFESGTFVQKNFHVDFWKKQNMGDKNPMYWQDVFLGKRNKALRLMENIYLDDRPMADLNLIKYSGNKWGAHFLMAQGFDPEGENRYELPELFAEGATWILPEYIGPNYVRVKEFGTPEIKSIHYTRTKPKRVALGAGGVKKLGKYQLEVRAIDPVLKTVHVVIKDGTGALVKEKVLGPFNETLTAKLPQDMASAHKLQIQFDDVQAELDMLKPFTHGNVGLYLYTEVKELKKDTPYECDPRFTVRPDVCGHCYQFNELLIDNPKAIVLDRKHRVYEGPKNEKGIPLFKIVIDDFDGEMIHGWHIETTSKGVVHESDNLAFNPRNNIDVLVGVNGTIEGFLRTSLQDRLAYQERWRTSARPMALAVDRPGLN
ncbi:hypothetical protein [Desulfoluna sp.]|uniref:hypothetical protein n=1 Tax=Desulfoluna sp. TaxID=2045199 RepID=UPI002606DA3A|nr:hypothetical protein [Desulfoluna sp.]